MTIDHPSNPVPLRDRLADLRMVWPSLTISVELAPWHWRLDLYRDSIERAGHLMVGPLTVDWFANRPAFPREP